MTLSARAFVAALIGLAFVTAGPHCSELRGRLYVLTEASAFSEGCFDGLCRCPISLTPEVAGIFFLDELPTLGPGPNRFFALDTLHARVGRGASAIRIQGEGLYQNDPVSRTQRLELELRFDGGEARSFDSGLVADTAGFPQISIEVNEFDDACFDTRLLLHAVPLDLACQRNADCAEDAFCQRPQGHCDGLGICSPRGDACLAIADPVCGCDGKTYGNACEAGLVGMSVAARGVCPGT